MIIVSALLSEPKKDSRHSREHIESVSADLYAAKIDGITLLAPCEKSTNVVTLGTVSEYAIGHHKNMGGDMKLAARLHSADAQSQYFVKPSIESTLPDIAQEVLQVLTKPLPATTKLLPVYTCPITTEAHLSFAELYRTESHHDTRRIALVAMCPPLTELPEKIAEAFVETVQRNDPYAFHRLVEHAKSKELQRKLFPTLTLLAILNHSNIQLESSKQDQETGSLAFVWR